MENNEEKRVRVVLKNDEFYNKDVLDMNESQLRLLNWLNDNDDLSSEVSFTVIDEADVTVI